MRSKLVISIFALFLICGCSSSTPKPEPEAKELTVDKKKDLASAPETNLLDEGKRLFQAGLYTVARDQFESLISNYPLSPYVEFAEIKLADSYMQTNDFQEAANRYEQFTKNHPVSDSSSYALLMAGRAYQLSQKGIGRDTSALDKALEYYAQVIAKYPGTIFADNAAQYKAKVEKDLAASEQFVMDYYKRKQNTAALQVRDEDYKSRWANLVNQPPKSAKAKRATLATVAAPGDFGTPVIKQDLESMKSVQSSESRSDKAKSSQGPDLIQSVECRNDGARRVTFFLNSALDDAALKASIDSMNSSEAGLVVRLPKPNGRALKQDCFASDDLSVSSDGRIELKAQAKADLMALNNPPRLMMILPK